MVVFDSHYSGSARWKAGEDGRLHLIALASGRIPGFRRLPQPDALSTVDLLGAPIAQALKELDARIDHVHLHALDDSCDFVRALARLLTPNATLSSSGLTSGQRDALADAGFAFNG